MLPFRRLPGVVERRGSTLVADVEAVIVALAPLVHDDQPLIQDMGHLRPDAEGPQLVQRVDADGDGELGARGVGILLVPLVLLSGAPFHRREIARSDKEPPPYLRPTDGTMNELLRVRRVLYERTPGTVGIGAPVSKKIRRPIQFARQARSGDTAGDVGLLVDDDLAPRGILAEGLGHRLLRLLLDDDPAVIAVAVDAFDEEAA